MANEKAATNVPPSKLSNDPKSSPNMLPEANSDSFSNTPQTIVTTTQSSSEKSNSDSVKGLLLGSTPEQELLLRPRWLVFSANEGYQNSQYCQFTITNIEETAVAFRMRTRNPNFPLLSHCHGFLEPLQSVEVTVIVPSFDQWPRDATEIIGRRHKIVVENLLLPDYIEKPLDRRECEILCRKIFHNTATKHPLTRVYIKLNVLLPKISDEPATATTAELPNSMNP